MGKSSEKIIEVPADAEWYQIDGWGISFYNREDSIKKFGYLLDGCCENQRRAISLSKADGIKGKKIIYWTETNYGNIHHYIKPIE